MKLAVWPYIGRRLRNKFLSSNLGLVRKGEKERRRGKEERYEIALQLTVDLTVDKTMQIV